VGFTLGGCWAAAWRTAMACAGCCTSGLTCPPWELLRQYLRLQISAKHRQPMLMPHLAPVETPPPPSLEEEAEASLEDPLQPVHVVQVQEEQEVEQQPAQLPLPHAKVPLPQAIARRTPPP
jgi:hypothetical protein